jgi:predicted transcriptional regulator
MTNKLKRAAVYLRRQGVSSQIIAKALGLTRQQVAAYVAWDTMRTKR